MDRHKLGSTFEESVVKVIEGGGIDLELSQLQVLIGSSWEVTSSLTWTAPQYDKLNFLLQQGLSGKFSARRNWGAWMSQIVLPLLSCVVLAYLAHLLPPQQPMAMPRVALTLLALVSISGMHATISHAVPLGTVTLLGCMVLGALLSIVIITGLHCVIFMQDDEHKRHQLRYLCIRTLPPTILLLFVVIPVIVVGCGIGSQFSWMIQFLLVKFRQSASIQSHF